MPRTPGREDMPHSRKQERWAYAAEDRGELKRGTAKRWSRRRKRREQRRRS